MLYIQIVSNSNALLLSVRKQSHCADTQSTDELQTSTGAVLVKYDLNSFADFTMQESRDRTYTKPGATLQAETYCN